LIDASKGRTASIFKIEEQLNLQLCLLLVLDYHTFHNGKEGSIFLREMRGMQELRTIKGAEAA
jgi:hypothetical protein